MVPDTGSLIHSVLFYICPQLSHLFIHIFLEIKIVQLSQPKLTIVIIQTFLRYTYFLCRILKVHFLFRVFWLRSSHIKLPPMFNQSYNFRNRPLFTAVIDYLRALVLRVHLQIAIVLIDPFSPLILDEYKGRLKIVLGNLAISLSYLLKRDKLVVARVIDENDVLGYGSMLFKNIR